MKIIKGQIIRLEPNNKQITYFKKACVVARFAYNWALGEWMRQYEQDKAYRDDCLSKGIEVDEIRLNRPSQFKFE